MLADEELSMKTKAIQSLLILSVIGVFSASVLAAPTGPAYRISMAGSGYGVGGVNGGAFLATPLAGGANWDNLNIDGPFWTFCAEPTVMGFGGWATVDDRVYFAGGNANGLPVPAQVRSVLAHWFSGGFGALGLNNDATGNMLLQAYIWQNIQGSLPNAGWVTFYNNNLAAINALGTNYGGGHPLAGSVKVLNLWNSQTNFDLANDRQSQFVIVPVPGAILLGMIGLSAAARLRRHA